MSNISRSNARMAQNVLMSLLREVEVEYSRSLRASFLIAQCEQSSTIRQVILLRTEK